METMFTYKSDVIYVMKDKKVARFDLKARNTSENILRIIDIIGEEKWNKLNDIKFYLSILTASQEENTVFHKMCAYLRLANTISALEDDDYNGAKITTIIVDFFGIDPRKF